MKNKLPLLLLLVCLQSAYGQTLKKYPAGKSGCTVQLYCNPGNFQENTSPDSSVVYSTECVAAGITYQVICVKLVQAAPSMELAGQVLEQYLDFLKGSYEVSKTKGYTRGLKLKSNTAAWGISDTWNDKDNNYLSVKGWTDGRFITVLITISAKEQASARINAFLDSVTFPAPRK